jgi:hypothetical protein
MATAPRRQAQFIQRRLARRAGASSLTRLADQFQGQIQDLTGQFETEFSRYQQQVNELMRPYEEASRRYATEQVPAYEQAVAAFNERLSAWQTQAEIAQRPPTRSDFRVRESSTQGNSFLFANLPDRFSNIDQQQSRYVPLRDQARAFGLEVRSNVMAGREIGGTIYLPSDDSVYYEDGYFFRRQGRMPEEFRETAPVAPEVPMAPQIQEFDQSSFDQRRAQLQEGFQREVAERRGARLSAVRRRNRTMLSGAQ